MEHSTHITVTTTDKRVWHLVPSLPTPGVPGVLRLDFRCGNRRATLFKPATSRVARLITPSGKRLPLAECALLGAEVDEWGNLRVGGAA